MNAIRLVSKRTLNVGGNVYNKTGMTCIQQRMLHGFRFNKNNGSNIFRKYNKHSLLLNHNSKRTAIGQGIVGGGVYSLFHKSSNILWCLPFTALLSHTINTLPFDVAYGLIIPYHAYIGLEHIFTDYLKSYVFVAYIFACILFVGLQNLNWNGEGISKTVYRTFKRTVPMPKTKDKQI